MSPNLPIPPDSEEARDFYVIKAGSCMWTLSIDEGIARAERAMETSERMQAPPGGRLVLPASWAGFSSTVGRSPKVFIYKIRRGGYPIDSTNQTLDSASQRRPVTVTKYFAMCLSQKGGLLKNLSSPGRRSRRISVRVRSRPASHCRAGSQYSSVSDRHQLQRWRWLAAKRADRLSEH